MLIHPCTGSLLVTVCLRRLGGVGCLMLSTAVITRVVNGALYVQS